MRDPFSPSHLDKNALGTQGSLLADVGISVLQMRVDLVWSMDRISAKTSISICGVWAHLRLEMCESVYAHAGVLLGRAGPTSEARSLVISVEAMLPSAVRANPTTNLFRCLKSL